MGLELSDLKKVGPDDGTVFREFYTRFPPEHSDLLPGTMCTWRDYMTYHYTIYNDHLVIVGDLDGKRYLRPPVGPMDREVFADLLELSREHGWDPLMSMIGTRTLNWMKGEFPGVVFQQHRDYFEYVYLSSDLSELPGKDYLKVRNYLNKFRRCTDHIVESISEDNMGEVRDFLIKWCERKGCHDDPFLLHERQANFNAIDDMFRLGMDGLLIRVDGQVEAFSIFEKMSEEMVVVHHEKANPDIVGLYQAINNETARSLAGRYRFINRESDMGVEGLRMAKLRYRPHHMLEVYDARAG